MYNFFMDSKFFQKDKQSFESAFIDYCQKEVDLKLPINRFSYAIEEFIKGLNNLFAYNVRFIEISNNHAYFIDSAINIQLFAINAALTRVEQSKNLKSIDKQLGSILDSITSTLKLYEEIIPSTSSNPRTPIFNDALQIMNFVKALLSETNPLNDTNVYGSSTLVGKNRVPGIPNFIQSICRPSVSTQTTLYDPQLFLRNSLEKELRQFQPQSSEKAYKKLSSTPSAYYLNLMAIAATINDGKTHFLGLDRISWDAYLGSSCVEIAEFFSIENTQDRLSPLTIPRAFTITKEQAIAFLRDDLKYPPLQLKTGSPASAGKPTISLPVQIASPFPFPKDHSSAFIPVQISVPQASAATPPPMPSPVFQTPPRPTIQEALVLYDYEKQYDNDISAKKDDRLTVVNMNAPDNPGWAKVQKQDGDINIYLFPANYLQLA